MSVQYRVVVVGYGKNASVIGIDRTVYKIVSRVCVIKIILVVIRFRNRIVDIGTGYLYPRIFRRDSRDALIFESSAEWSD